MLCAEAINHAADLRHALHEGRCEQAVAVHQFGFEQNVHVRRRTVAAGRGVDGHHVTAVRGDRPVDVTNLRALRNTMILVDVNERRRKLAATCAKLPCGPHNKQQNHKEEKVVRCESDATASDRARDNILPTTRRVGSTESCVAPQAHCLGLERYANGLPIGRRYSIF